MHSFAYQSCLVDVKEKKLNWIPKSQFFNLFHKALVEILITTLYEWLPLSQSAGVETTSKVWLFWLAAINLGNDFADWLADLFSDIPQSLKLALHIKRFQIVRARFGNRWSQVYASGSFPPSNASSLIIRQLFWPHSSDELSAWAYIWQQKNEPFSMGFQFCAWNYYSR